MTRFDVFLVPLDPVVGSELRKTRPCVVVSPDELNDHLRTVLVAPLTTGGRTYRTRVACSFQGKVGHVALDQLRVVDKSRLVRYLGTLAERERSEVLRVLRAMFAP